MRAGVEVRAVPGGRTLEGYAAVFDVPTRIGGTGGFTETVRVGAFRASLASQVDILALQDHAPDRVLARTSAGNLILKEDNRGLHFTIDLPETSVANDVLALVQSRTAGGASFGFRVPAGGDTWSAADRRELRAVDLIEISIVSAWPAYAQTTVSARARGVVPALSHAARSRILEAL